MITDKKDTKKAERSPDQPKLGRPSKWQDDFPERLEKLMSEGLSFEACCGELGISKDTGYSFVKDKPAFAEAKAMGEVKGQAFWEREAISGLWSSKDSKFNTTAFIFVMKNRFNWRDRKEIAGDINIGAKPFAEVYKGWSDKQLDNEMLAILDRLVPKNKGPTKL